MAAIGDAIVRKDRQPRCAIETGVSLLHFAGRIINCKNYRTESPFNCGWPVTFTTGGVLSMSTGSLNLSPVSFCPGGLSGASVATTLMM